MQRWDIRIEITSIFFQVKASIENTCSVTQNNLVFPINVEYFIRLEEQNHIYI